MKVLAKCTAKAWDSQGEIYGYPFLCSPGEVYEIPVDGQLAQLTVTAVAYDKDGNAIRYYRDHNNELKTVRIPKPAYIFEFDRTMTRTAEGVPVNHDYTCDQCGYPAKSLNELGSHVYGKHREDNLLKDDEPVAEPELTLACDQCDKKFKDRRGLNGHQRFAHKKKSDDAETASVPV